jgi:hypothetical protein
MCISYGPQTRGVQLVPLPMAPVRMRQIAMRILYSENCSAVSAQGKRDVRKTHKAITSPVDVDRLSPILV